MKKRIAFIKVGSFSLVNGQVLSLLRTHFPEYEIDVFDVLEISLGHKWWLVVDLLYVLREFGLGLCLRKRQLKRGVLMTTYLMGKIRQWITDNLSAEDYLFSIQTQSLFDASIDGVPHFVYTDHTALAFLYYPTMKWRDLWLQYPRQWIEMEKEIYQHAALNLTTSYFAAESIRNDYDCAPEKVACIYSGINTIAAESESFADKTGKEILFVGIDWKRKGGADLVAAFERVLAVHPDASLTIVGCTPRIDVPHCRVVGRVSREAVGEYYRQAAVFCMPSLVEPSAVALVEAAAYGLPVVSTDVGGTADRVIDGETGYLVPPGDVEQLATALIRLLDDPQKRAQFGRAGQRLAQERFTWERVGNLLKQHIDTVLQAQGAYEKVPRVSIGMPVYNGEKYLPETLDSILAQTFTDFELVICDNASTDGTADICRAYAERDGRIRYHRNATNLGAAPNYNLAFNLSCGKYFKWNAHDDPIAPTYLEKCVTLLDDVPEAIMCYPKTRLINRHSQKSSYMPNYQDNYNLRDDEPHVRFRKFFHLGDQCHPVFGLMRRSVLKKTILIGSFSSSDRLLLGELAICGKCYEIPHYLAFRRLHPNNSVSRNLSHEELTAWFDPNAIAFGGRRPRLMLEYVKAIGRAAPGLKEKLLCYVELARFFFESLLKKIKTPKKIVEKYLASKTSH